MANSIFLDLATLKTGAIKDPDQTKTNYKNQIEVLEFNQSIKMDVDFNNAHSASRVMRGIIQFVVRTGCYEVELKQALVGGDSITNATFSFPVMNKTGHEENTYEIKATGGIITKVERTSPPIWTKEGQSAPALVNVEISYDKLEEKSLVHSKQMSYSWKEL